MFQQRQAGGLNMSEAIDSPRESTLVSELADFGRGFVNALIENPVNGLAQIANRTGLVDLPELDIVDEPKSGAPVAIGSLAGGITLFFGLNMAGGKLLGDLGGRGLAGTALRAGITGAVFEGALKPTDPGSKSFWMDRATNGLVGATTFAGMAATGYGLNRTGLFAVPEARTLMGSISYGALSGAGGGLAHAQADAIFKQGRAMPTLDALKTDLTTFTAFGAGFGAMGFGYHRLSSTLRGGPVEIQSEKASARLWTDGNGEPVKVESVGPSTNMRGVEIKTTNVKLTTGSWSSSARARYEGDSSWWMRAQPFTVQSVNQSADGSLTVVDTAGTVRTYQPDGKFERYQIGEAESPAGNASYTSAQGERIVVNGEQTTRFDEQGRLQAFHDKKAGSYVDVHYDDKTGAVKYLTVKTGEGPDLTFSNESGQTWRIYTRQSTLTGAHEPPPSAQATHSQFKWQGEITATGAGEATSFQIKTAAGEVVDLRPGQPLSRLTEVLSASAKLAPGASGHPVITVDRSGNVFIRAGEGGGFEKPLVNGTAVTAQDVPIRPGDSVTVRVDVGDRYPVWETREIKWGTAADGNATLGGQSLRPGDVFDLVTR